MTPVGSLNLPPHTEKLCLFDLVAHSSPAWKTSRTKGKNFGRRTELFFLQNVIYVLVSYLMRKPSYPKAQSLEKTTMTRLFSDTMGAGMFEPQ